jgi:endonuclease/exonuclease/phosphatase family metal-dependent hydrolase
MFLFFVLLIGPGTSFGQLQAYDTLRVMTYNTLNYGFPATGSCPALLTESKHTWLRTVLEYSNPDILGLEKMDASPATFTSDTVIQRVLDSVCNGCYGHTPFTNNSGYEKENMLYYKSAKIGWSGTTTIYSGDPNISDINLHHLYYKSPTLALTHDTIFLNIILVHLESGPGSAAERATEMTGAMSWLNSHVTLPGNYIFMGDLNTQSSGESCFLQLVASPDSNTLFFDPVSQSGNWSTDPTAFAHYLTQSTRTTDPGDCGSTDGMTNRFDHILCTKQLMDGTDSLQYIPGTFDIVGQDGLHVNSSLTASPPDISVPANVLNALYYMSEHLPVMLQLAVGGQPSTGINTLSDNNTFSIYPNPANSMVHVQGLNHQTELTIYSVTGAKLLTVPASDHHDIDIDISSLSPGLYFIAASDGGAQRKLVIAR